MRVLINWYNLWYFHKLIDLEKELDIVAIFDVYSPVYHGVYYLRDEKKFLVGVLKYGIEFKEV